jgi:hypothetical protein
MASSKKVRVQSMVMAILQFANSESAEKEDMTT